MTDTKMTAEERRAVEQAIVAAIKDIADAILADPAGSERSEPAHPESQTRHITGCGYANCECDLIAETLFNWLLQAAAKPPKET